MHDEKEVLQALNEGIRRGRSQLKSHVFVGCDIQFSVGKEDDEVYQVGYEYNVFNFSAPNFARRVRNFCLHYVHKQPYFGALASKFPSID